MYSGKNTSHKSKKMRNSIGKITSLIMTLSVLALTGCSSNVAGNLSETGDNSSDMQEIFQTDNDVSVPDSIPEEDSTESGEVNITDALEVPEVNNGVNYFEPDYISIHFNWNAIDGAEGYEVCEEIKPENTSDDRYSEPQFSEVTDHYYLTGGQDDFVHRIKVRAFKPKTVVGYLVSGVPTP